MLTITAETPDGNCCSIGRIDAARLDDITPEDRRRIEEAIRQFPIVRVRDETRRVVLEYSPEVEAKRMLMAAEWRAAHPAGEVAK